MIRTDFLGMLWSLRRNKAVDGKEFTFEHVPDAISLFPCPFSRFTRRFASYGYCYEDVLDVFRRMTVHFLFIPTDILTMHDCFHQKHNLEFSFDASQTNKKKLASRSCDSLAAQNLLSKS